VKALLTDALKIVYITLLSSFIPFIDGNRIDAEFFVISFIVSALIYLPILAYQEVS
jgi:hypothetical protein